MILDKETKRNQIQNRPLAATIGMPLEWNSVNYEGNLDEMLTHMKCTHIYIGTCGAGI